VTIGNASAGGLAEEQVDVEIEALHEGLSPRATAHDLHHAAALAEVFSELPPIVVHASTMRIIDGIHRVLAARLLSKKRIRARLFHGSDLEASVEAIQANIVHGKPLTINEREAAVQTLLGLQPDWSDRRIAEVCGLSPMTVGRVRDRIPAGNGAVAQPARRVGRDGKRRPVDPIRARHLVAKALKDNPDTSAREVAEATGASPATVRDVRSRLQRGEDVLSPRQARAFQRHRRGDVAFPWRQDEGPCIAPHVEPDFTQWFESRVLKSDDDWLAWADRIPIGYVYGVADAARRCGDVWHQFARALEARARQSPKR
jgi:ParB-like chromosome segregation protein Spo0J